MRNPLFIKFLHNLFDCSCLLPAVYLYNLLIDIYRDWWKRSEPFSDTWTDCYNKLQYQLYLHDEYDKEANEALNEKIK